MTSHLPHFLWEDVEGESGYELVIKDVGRGDLYIIPLDADETEYTLDKDYELDYSYMDDDDELYYFEWYVRAKNHFQYMPSDKFTFFIIAELVPPSDLNGPEDGCTGGTYTFKWTKTPTLTYEVEYSNDDFTTNIVQVEDPGKDSAEVEIATAGTYKWRARAVSIIGEKSEWVVYDGTFEVKQTLLPANLITPANACKGTSFTFTWDTNAEHTYTAEYTSTATGATWNAITSGTSDGSASTTVAESGTYKWRVKSNSPCGESEWVEGSTFIAENTPIPTNLVTPNEGCKGASFTFSWDVKTDHTYTAEYAKTGMGSTWTNIVSATSNSTADATVSNEGAYKWRLKANGPCGDSEWAEGDTFNVKVTENPTSANMNVNPTTGDSTTVFNASWTNKMGYTYNVQYKESGSGTWTDACTNTSGPSCSMGPIATGGTYQWRVLAKDPACGDGEWVTDDTTFEVEVCVPPTWNTLPVNCTTNGSNVQISWNAGNPSGLQYKFQMRRTNPATNWGDLDSSWSTTTNFTVQASDSNFGNFEFRIQYDDNPSVSSSACEGTLTTSATFNYVIPPANLQLVSEQGYTNPTAGIADGSGNKVGEFGYDAYNGMEYDIELTTDSGPIYIDTIVASTGCVPLGYPRWYPTNGLDLNSGCIEDGWWKFRVRSRSVGGTSCVSDWVDDPSNHEGVEKQDFCYGDVMYQVGTWNTFMGAGQYGITFGDPNPAGRAVRIVFSNNEIFEDGEDVTSNWLLTTGGTSYIDFMTPGLFPAGFWTNGKNFKHLLIEMQYDMDSCTSSATVDDFVGSNNPLHYVGIEFVNGTIGFKKCNDYSTEPCDGF